MEMEDLEKGSGLDPDQRHKHRHIVAHCQLSIGHDIMQATYPEP